METVSPRMRVALKLVAGLFFVSGVLAEMEVIASLMHGTLHVSAGLLSLFIGQGLVRLDQRWWKCSLLYTRVLLVGVLLCSLLLFAGIGTPSVTVLGHAVGEAPRLLTAGLLGLVFLVGIWQYRVLTHPEVHDLFRGTSSEAPGVGGAAAVPFEEWMPLRGCWLTAFFIVLIVAPYAVFLAHRSGLI